jgi:hypothetical protein
MTTGLSYSTYVDQISTMAVVASSDVAFQAILPQMITYAENRMYRDINFMFTSTSLHGASFVLTPGNRNLNFSINLSTNTDPAQGTFVVSDQINLLTDASGNPSATTDPDTCVRVPLLPTTKEFLDAVYGSSLTANRGKPQYFVPFNETLFFLGPVPDQAYPVEVVGTYRPNSLGYLPAVTSATTGGNITFASAHGLANNSSVSLAGFTSSAWNGSFVASVTGTTTITIPTTAATATVIGTVASNASTTFISLYLPDVFIMASMIYISAYQRNFGRANDDPQMAVTYESQYQALLKSAVVEEARKQFQSSGWASQSPATVATPSRG